VWRGGGAARGGRRRVLLGGTVAELGERGLGARHQPPRSQRPAFEPQQPVGLRLGGRELADHLDACGFGGTLGGPNVLGFFGRLTAPSVQEEAALDRSEEHTSELQSLTNIVCRLLLEKKKRERVQDSAHKE